MSRNLYKAGFVMMDEDARVIDMSGMLEKRMREAEERRRYQQKAAALASAEEGFVEGLQAENVDALLQADPMAAQLQSAALEEQEQLNQEIEASRQELADLQMQIQQLKEQAQAEIDAMKVQAYEEAKQSGYADGYAEGLAQLKEKEEDLVHKQSVLEQDYEQKIYELEPVMVDALTDIYSHIFQVDAAEHQGLVCTLLEDTLLKTDSIGSMMIHVSREDLSYVQEQKSQILEMTGLQPGTVEIVGDATLSRAQCMIETEGGIYDCSLDTELAELKRRLMLLAYRRE